MRSIIFQQLRYGEKHRGRYLRADLANYGLLKGDRLEPNESLPDISAFESTIVPFTCVFWRMSAADRVLHESPVLSVVGVTPQSYHVDLLHAWHLGPLQEYLGSCAWLFLETELYTNDIHHLDTEQLRKVRLLQLKSKIFRYYKDVA